MAVKTRKCDRSIVKVAPPPMECCPICMLPPFIPKIHPQGCEFYVRCRRLQYDTVPPLSHLLRSKAFREYHSTICPVCRQPVDECAKQTESRAIKRMAKRLKDASKKIDKFADVALVLGVPDSPIAEDYVPCKPPDESKYTPVAPGWYTK